MQRFTITVEAYPDGDTYAVDHDVLLGSICESLTGQTILCDGVLFILEGVKPDGC